MFGESGLGNQAQGLRLLLSGVAFLVLTLFTTTLMGRRISGLTVVEPGTRPPSGLSRVLVVILVAGVVGYLVFGYLFGDFAGLCMGFMVMAVPLLLWVSE